MIKRPRRKGCEVTAIGTVRLALRVGTIAISIGLTVVRATTHVLAVARLVLPTGLQNCGAGGITEMINPPIRKSLTQPLCCAGL